MVGGGGGGGVLSRKSAPGWPTFRGAAPAVPVFAAVATLAAPPVKSPAPMVTRAAAPPAPPELMLCQRAVVDASAVSVVPFAVDQNAVTVSLAALGVTDGAEMLMLEAPAAPFTLSTPVPPEVS